MDALLRMIALDEGPQEFRPLPKHNDRDALVRWLRMRSYQERKKALQLLSELGESVRPNPQVQYSN